MRKIIVTLVIMTNLFCGIIQVNAEMDFLSGHSVGYGPGGACVAGIGTFTWEGWHKLHELIAFANGECKEMDEAWKNISIDVKFVSKPLNTNNIYVSFEISGSGFTDSEKSQVARKIENAIQEILNNYFD